MKWYEVVIYYYCLQHIQIIPKYHYNKEQVVYKTDAEDLLYCKTCKLLNIFSQNM